LNASFGDDDINNRGLELNIKSGADRANLKCTGTNDERTCGIFRDAEVRFTLNEKDVTFAGGKLFNHLTVDVELDE
jgi:uncharacterized protein YllA (UPF0747 family)